MAHDASSLLGSPQLAGCTVNQRGLGRKVGMSAALGGGLGAAVGMAAAKRAEDQRTEAASPTEQPKFGRVGHLAVSDGEIAVVRTKSGIVRVQLDAIVARVPRDQVVSVELGSGTPMMASPITVTFTDGGTWELEVPRPSKKSAEEVVALFA